MKVAIVGTAPQWQEAPFEDTSWKIWGVSGLFPAAPRINRLYEIHDLKTYEAGVKPREGFEEFALSMKEHFFCHPDLPFPEATKYDFEKRLKHFGPYFTSSVGWMIADAILEGAEEIGIWGVNMAHETEYGYQKPGCTFLLGWARALGIKITIPDTSELLAAPWIYAYQPKPPVLIANEDRKEKYRQNIKLAEQNMMNAVKDKAFCEGVIHNIEHFEKNWGA